MQIMLFNAVKTLCHTPLFKRLCSSNSIQESISIAVERKQYNELLNILNDPKQYSQTPNPFSFLSTYRESKQTRIIDEILQAFVYVRPRSRPHVVYSCLVFYTLENPNQLPLALAILQRTIRSRCLPVEQTHLFLSQAWVNRGRECETVSSIVKKMQCIGYSLDTGTCNYLVLSLCKVDLVDEAVRVLKGMIVAGCIPDLDTYGSLIVEMSERRMMDGVCEMIKEMVGKFGLNPRPKIIFKALDAFRANKDIWRAVEVVEFLESQNVHLGFAGYEVVLDGCLQSEQFVLGMKIVIKMTDRGFIPYINTRQKLVEGLVSIGEVEMVRVVRDRFSKLKS